MLGALRKRDFLRLPPETSQPFVSLHKGHGESVISLFTWTEPEGKARPHARGQGDPCGASRKTFASVWHEGVVITYGQVTHLEPHGGERQPEFVSSMARALPGPRLLPRAEPGRGAKT